MSLGKFMSAQLVNKEGTVLITFDENGMDVTEGAFEVGGKVSDYRKPITDTLTGTVVNTHIFVADARYVIESIREKHSTPADAGGTLTYGVAKGTTTPANSTAQHSTAINTNFTANTTQTATITTQTTIDAGDSIARVVVNATNLVGTATLILRRVS